MKNKLNKKIFGLMAVGISAGLMVCPIVAHADEGEPDGAPEQVPEENADFSNDEDVAEEASEQDAEQIQDEIDDAEGYAEEAEEEFEEAESLAENAADNLNAINDEQPPEQESAPGTVIEDIHFVQEAEAVISEATEMMKDAKDSFDQACENLENAQQAADDAKALLDEAESRQEEIQDAIEEAGDEKAEIEAEVEANETILNTAKEVLDSYDDVKDSGFQQILESQNELKEQGANDEKYQDTSDKLAQEVVQYYSIKDDIGDAGDVSFEKTSQDYAVDYEKDENGNFNPVTTNLTYWTVKYKDSDGNPKSINYLYNVDADGNVSLSKITNIDIQQESKVFQEQTDSRYEDADHNEFTASEGIYSIDLENDGGPQRRYAIDTESDAVSSNVYTPQDVDSENLKETYTLKEGSRIAYEKVLSTVDEDGYEKIGQIRQVEYQKYEYTRVETVSVYDDFSVYDSRQAALAAGESKLGELYPDDDSYSVKIREGTYVGSSAKYMYYIAHTTTTTEEIEVPHETKIYNATEYIFIPAKEKIERTIANLTISTEDFGSTKDEEFKTLMEAHKVRSAEAETARKAYDAAKEAFDRSKKDLDDVNARIEELKGQLISDAELARLRNEHAIALARIDAAQDAKNSAKDAIEKAEDALKKAENRLDEAKSRIRLFTVYGNLHNLSANDVDSGDDDAIDGHAYAIDFDVLNQNAASSRLRSLNSAANLQKGAVANTTANLQKGAVTNTSATGKAATSQSAVSSSSNSEKGRFINLKSGIPGNDLQGKVNIRKREDYSLAFASERTPAAASFGLEDTALNPGSDLERQRQHETAKKIAFLSSVGVGVITAEEALRRKLLLKRLMNNSSKELMNRL